MNNFEITPTFSQAGQLIFSGLLLNDSFTKVAGGCKDIDLEKAEISTLDYLNELFLIATCASLFAIESSKVSPNAKTDIVNGFKQSITESDNEQAIYAFKYLDEVYPYYVEAHQEELSKEVNDRFDNEIDFAMGDRLFGLGDDNQDRGAACVSLCLFVPNAFWQSHITATNSSLMDFGLVMQY